MGQLVGAGIQFPVRQTVTFTDDSHGIWCTPHLLFKQLVYTFFTWISNRCRIPFMEHLIKLDFVQERQPIYGQVGISHNRLEQNPEVVQ